MLIAASFFTALALMVYQNYYAVSPDHISSFQYAFVLFDLLTFGFTIWNCMRMAIFAVHIILVWSFLIQGHIEGTLNRQLKLALAMIEQQQQQRRQRQRQNCTSPSKEAAKQSTSSPQMGLLLSSLHCFYREHSWLEWLMRRFNGRLVSPLAYTGITANVVVNLVLVGSLLFRPQRRHSHRLPLGASTLAVLIIIAQVMISLVATAGLTAISSRLYRSDRLLYRLQLALAGSQYSDSCEVLPGNEGKGGQRPRQQWRHFCQSSRVVLAKLHLAVFYETVCTRDRFCFTFGPHAKINYKSVFEFIFVYSSFIMYVATMVKNEQL